MASTTCGWCGRYANLTYSGGTALVPHRKVGSTPWDLMASYKCDHCGRLVLLKMTGGENVSFERMRDSDVLVVIDETLDVAQELVTSLPRHADTRTFSDVPAHIGAAASEAFSCLSIGATRGAVALARAVVEAVAKDKGITRGTLNEKIDRLAEGQFIRRHIQEAAHEVRYLGNEMAHGDFTEPVTHEEANLALTLMAELLFEVYESPARVEQARQARLARRTADGLPTPG